MPRGVPAGPKKVGRGPKGHKLAEEFPSGTVLQDLSKKQWQLSSIIGQGGFGLIYIGSDEVGKQASSSSENYVIKIEPVDNGPLYCEMHFYQRTAKPDKIQSFIKDHKLRYLSVPPYIATGRHLYSGKDYRFLVMPRFGTDLQKYLVKSGGHFTAKIVFGVGLRMLDAFEFLHNNEYVHADVKAANILTGFRAGSEVPNEVYLVDYGLAYRYTVDGVHKEYKEDPRKAHDGTIEFTSRDAHKGVVPSRRADLEILGYCMLQWLCGKLPWEDNLSDPGYVAASKEKLTANPNVLISACLSGPRTPSLDCMCKYMEKVNSLKYDSTPDYKAFRDLLKSAASRAGLKDEWRLELDSLDKLSSGSAPGGRQKGRKRTSGEVSTPKEARNGKATNSPAKKPRTTPKAKIPPKSKLPASSPATPRSKAKRSTTTSPTSNAQSPTSPARSVAFSKATASSSNGKRYPKTPMTTAVQGRRSPKAPLGKKKVFAMPPVTKPGSANESGPSKKTTVRRVRRVAAVQSDMCVQTSPGLLNNR